MKNLIVIVAGVAVVGGLAFAGYKMSSNPDSDNPENSVKDAKSEVSSKDQDGSDGNYFETLKDLMERGKSMRCTYHQELPNDGGVADGVVYMADKNARTEITIKEETGHTGKMYAIVDQEYTYSWVEGSSSGFKMTLEASELGEKNEQTVSGMTDEIDFKCEKWKKDNSKFEAPTDVEFQDISEMMEGFEDVDLEQTIKDAEAQSKEFLCEHCKTAPTPELVAECLGDIVCD